MTLACYEWSHRSIRAVSILMNVSKSTVARWNSQGYDHTPSKRSSRKVNNLLTSQITLLVDKDPFISIREIVDSLDQKVSWSTVQRCLRTLRMSYKSTCRTYKHQPVSLTHPYFTNASPYDDDCICVDEASFVSCDTPRRGWSKRGDTIHKHPPKRRRVVSLLLAIKGETFSAFLDSLPCGGRVLMDNASIHKTCLVHETCVRKRIQPVYTPPYSPWFNPVEFAFSVIKRSYRKARAGRYEAGPYFTEDIIDSLRSVRQPLHTL